MHDGPSCWPSCLFVWRFAILGDLLSFSKKNKNSTRYSIPVSKRASPNCAMICFCTMSSLGVDNVLLRFLITCIDLKPRNSFLMSVSVMSTCINGPNWWAKCICNS